MLFLQFTPSHVCPHSPERGGSVRRPQAGACRRTFTPVGRVVLVWSQNGDLHNDSCLGGTGHAFSICLFHVRVSPLVRVLGNC